jgi:hypothetical protein
LSQKRPMIALSGLIVRRDKSPTSTTSEEAPCASRQLNNRFGQVALPYPTTYAWQLATARDRRATYLQTHQRGVDDVIPTRWYHPRATERRARDGQMKPRALCSAPTTTPGPSLQSSAALPAARRSREYDRACRWAKRPGHTIRKLR